MPPKIDSPVTAEQVLASINISDFTGATPKKNWHDGLFETWALKFGYENGMPVYGSIEVNAVEHHIYFLNDKHQCPIILKKGQTPEDYGVHPEK